MVPAGLNDFFLATAGAAASFIGLLFVAISFTLNDSKENEQERTTKRVLAESSYAALINVFFVSLIALVPHAKLGLVIFLMAWAGVGNSAHFVHDKNVTRRNRAGLAAMTSVYLVELAFGISLLLRGHNYVIPVWQIVTLLVVLFSVALVRAWELTGVRNEELARLEQSRRR